MSDIVENALYAEIDRLNARVGELEAERDADRRREYGYSQETVDALTAERDKLEAELAGVKASRETAWKRLDEDGQAVLKLSLELAEKKRDIAKLEAENRRLRALLHKCLMYAVFFSSDLVDEVKQALKEASHET
jgi:chromosome segregation ATPase